MNIEIISESFWLDNLRSHGTTMREFLTSIDKEEREHVKNIIFDHARELPHMYDVPGRQKPRFAERWHGKYGLLWHAKMRAAWLATPEHLRKECFDASDRVNALNWKADHNDRNDWRVSKELKHEAKFWSHRHNALCGEIYGEVYESPACLI